MMRTLTLICAFLLIGLTSFSQKVFDGGPGNTGTDWNTSENWNPDGVPTLTDDVEIDGYDVVIPTSIAAEAASVNIISGSLDMVGTSTLTVGSAPVKTEKAIREDSDDKESIQNDNNKTTN